MLSAGSLPLSYVHHTLLTNRNMVFQGKDLERSSSAVTGLTLESRP